MLGWDFIVSAIVITAVYVAYLAMAGVMATTLNEFYFGLIMIIGCAVLNVVVYTAYGGFTALWEGSLVTKPGHYIPPPLSPLTFIGQAIGSLFLAMSMPHLAIRLFTSRDIVAARRSWWIAGCTALMVWILGGWLPGIAALARFPGLRDPDLAFYKVLELAGTGIIGLGMGAVLAAIISTTDGMLMAVGAAGAYDVYGKTLRPTASERSVRRVMVAFMVLIGAISCVLTIYTPPWIPLFAMLALHLLGSAFAMPLLFGIYWPRATKYGAVSSMIVGFVACFASYFLGAPIFSWALFGVPASAAAMVIASLLTKPPKQEIVEKLCLELRRTP
jgi:Na+/proline symporter